MNSDEISLELDELDRHILNAKELLNTVEIERNAFEKKLVELKEAIRMQKHIIGTLNLKKSIKEREYWRSKN